MGKCCSCVEKVSLLSFYDVGGQNCPVMGIRQRCISVCEFFSGSAFSSMFVVKIKCDTLLFRTCSCWSEVTC